MLDDVCRLNRGGLAALCYKFIFCEPEETEGVEGEPKQVEEQKQEKEEEEVPAKIVEADA
jgi:hypothetical protein